MPLFYYFPSLGLLLIPSALLLFSSPLSAFLSLPSPFFSCPLSDIPLLTTEPGNSAPAPLHWIVCSQTKKWIFQLNRLSLQRWRHSAVPAPSAAWAAFTHALMMAHFPQHCSLFSLILSETLELCVCTSQTRSSHTTSSRRPASNSRFHSHEMEVCYVLRC